MELERHPTPSLVLIAIRIAAGIPTLDYAIPADQACDIWVRQIAPQNVQPTVASSPIFTEIIGTNDVGAKGQGSYEVNFNTCQQATLVKLGIPVDYWALPASATLSGGASLGSLDALGSYVFMDSAGATTYTLTTYGGPIYLLHSINDTSAGEASVTVDGVSVGIVNTLNVTPMATQNGTTNSVGLMRIAIVGGAAVTGTPNVPVSHPVVVTWTSGGVATLGVATPPGNKYFQHPTVIVGSVPLPSNTSTDATSTSWLSAWNEYNADIVANIALLSSDGLDIRYANSKTYYNGNPLMYTDGFHPTPLGGAALRDSILAVMQPNSVSPLVASLTSTSTTGGSNTSVDTVPILGMTIGGHCAKPDPTNSSAATSESTYPVWVSAKATNSVTVTHANVAGDDV